MALGLRFVRVLSTSRPAFSQHYKYNANAAGNFKHTKARNEKIPYDLLHIYDDNGGLIPITKAELLERHKTGIAGKKERIEIVAESPQVIVQVVDVEAVAAEKRAFRGARKAKRRETVAAKGPREHKEVQLHWHTDIRDMQHKFDRVKELLADGARVDLVFAPKSHTKWLEKSVALQKLEEFAQEFADTDATEWKERQYERGIGAIFLQG